MKKIFFVIGTTLLFFRCIYSWSGNTHQAMSEKAVYVSRVADMCYRLGFDRYLNHVLHTNFGNDYYAKPILDWIVFGAFVEDQEATIRSNNHFHNPIRTLDKAGLSDAIHWPKGGESLLVWAQHGDYQAGFKEGDNSWAKVREYYYYGLISTDPQIREDNFSRMFKGLGHQVHLIQDSAVPDHVRNDTHFLNSIPGEKTKNSSWRCIEGWAENNDGYVRSFLANVIKPVLPLSQILSYEGRNLVPITELVDTLDYRLYGNPKDTVSQGLAEYTNANFVSEDTIFTENLDPLDAHYFPYPKITSTRYYDKWIVNTKGQDGKDESRYYLIKEIDGQTINCFLRWNYLSYLLKANENPEKLRDYVYLDDWCHYEYCQLLVPRAAGYSSSLLDYFFRGGFEIRQSENDGIYAFAPYPDQGFNKKLVLFARNVTPGENMTNGKVSLVIRYRQGMGEDEFSSTVPSKPDLLKDKFIVVAYINPNDPEGKVSIASGEEFKFEFDLKEHPLPVNATDVTLTLVFKGTLGYEDNDAVAIGFKDISEPTCIEIFNDTDNICYNNIVGDYSKPEIVQYADIDKDGKITGSIDIDIIPRTIKLYKVSFNGQPVSDQNYYFDYAGPANQSVEIESGKYHRMYVLTDENTGVLFNFSMKYRRPAVTAVPYEPAWSVPYNQLQYFWEMEDGGPGSPILLPPKFFEISPRVNKLVFNTATGQYEHHYPGSENAYWTLRDKYFFNMLYLTQPSHPAGCACNDCKTYYPIKGMEWKANYVKNNIPVWY